MNDPRAPVVLAAFTHEMQASLLINELERHGIKAKSAGEMVAGFRAEAPGEVKVLVSTVDLDRARAVLSATKETGVGDVGRAPSDIDEPSISDAQPASRNQILRWGMAIGLAVIALGVLWQTLSGFWNP